MCLKNKTASCLVNPRACHETELNYTPTQTAKKIAVVGAGPAGLAYASIAAERGHQVDLFEAEKEIGGQFNMAKLVPGKEEFYETLRYFGKKIEKAGVKLHLNHRVTAQELIDGQYCRGYIGNRGKSKRYQTRRHRPPKGVELY